MFCGFGVQPGHHPAGHVMAEIFTVAALRRWLFAQLALLGVAGFLVSMAASGTLK